MAVRNYGGDTIGDNITGVDLISCGHSNNLAVTSFLRAAGNAGVIYSATFGTPLMRAGSVVGVTCTAVIQNFVASGTLAIEVQINGTAVFTGTSPSITANGTVSWAVDQAVGVDTFVAGDLLGVRIVEGAGQFTFRPIATVAIVVR